jgi:predicted ester cyclase
MQSDDASDGRVARASLDRYLSGHRRRARGEAMTSAAEVENSERYMQIAERWFTEGWAGNLAMADDIFSEELQTNGVRVGVAGPVGRIRERLLGFPNLTTSIVDMFVSGDKIAVSLIWRGTHTGPYGGIAATGKPVEVRDNAIWHFRDGKVTEILTLQDQFGLLKQIGYLPDSVRAA